MEKDRGDSWPFSNPLVENPAPRSAIGMSKEGRWTMPPQDRPTPTSASPSPSPYNSTPTSNSLLPAPHPLPYSHSSVGLLALPLPPPPPLQRPFSFSENPNSIKVVVSCLPPETTSVDLKRMFQAVARVLTVTVHADTAFVVRRV
jgi:hypothetical protein